MNKCASKEENFDVRHKPTYESRLLCCEVFPMHAYGKQVDDLPYRNKRLPSLMSAINRISHPWRKLMDPIWDLSFAPLPQISQIIHAIIT